MKKKQKFSIFIISAMSFTIFAGIPLQNSMITAHADSSIGLNSPIKSGNITDVDYEMNKISDYYFANELKGHDLPGWSGAYSYVRLSSRSTSMDLSLNVDNISNLTYSDASIEYVGENEFDNTRSPNEQTFTTASFSHMVKNTTSTKTTQGFNVGGKISILQIPIVLPDGITINAEGNTSTDQTMTFEETKTLTASPQNIKVPAGKKYLVTVDMAKKKFDGDVKYTGTGTNLKSTMLFLARMANLY